MRYSRQTSAEAKRGGCAINAAVTEIVCRAHAVAGPRVAVPIPKSREGAWQEIVHRSVSVRIFSNGQPKAEFPHLPKAKRARMSHISEDSHTTIKRQSRICCPLALGTLKEQPIVSIFREFTEGYGYSPVSAGTVRATPCLVGGHTSTQRMQPLQKRSSIPTM